MKQIEKALDLAQCELRAAYKRLGYADSNVLKLIDEALNQVKNCNIHDVILSLPSDNDCINVAKEQVKKLGYEIVKVVNGNEV